MAEQQHQQWLEDLDEQERARVNAEHAKWQEEENKKQRQEREQRAQEEEAAKKEAEEQRKAKEAMVMALGRDKMHVA